MTCLTNRCAAVNAASRAALIFVHDSKAKNLSNGMNRVRQRRDEFAMGRVN
jgi:hypothetical protein